MLPAVVEQRQPPPLPSAAPRVPHAPCIRLVGAEDQQQRERKGGQAEQHGCANLQARRGRERRVGRQPQLSLHASPVLPLQAITTNALRCPAMPPQTCTRHPLLAPSARTYPCLRAHTPPHLDSAAEGGQQAVLKCVLVRADQRGLQGDQQQRDAQPAQDAAAEHACRACGATAGGQAKSDATARMACTSLAGACRQASTAARAAGRRARPQAIPDKRGGAGKVCIARRRRRHFSALLLGTKRTHEVPQVAHGAAVRRP